MQSCYIRQCIMGTYEKLFKHPFSAVYTSAMYCIQLRLCVYIVCVGQQSVWCVCVYSVKCNSAARH